jgi:predicted Zn-dependent protease
MAARPRELDEIDRQRRAGDVAGAQQALDAVMAFPGEVLQEAWEPTLTLMAELARARGEHDLASVAAATAPLERHPWLPWSKKLHKTTVDRALRLLARKVLEAGKPAQAASLYARAVVRIPGELDLILPFAQALVAAGHRDAAIMSLRTTPKDFLDDSVDARLLLAELLVDSGDVAAARALAETFEARGIMESRSPDEEARRKTRAQALRDKLA